MKGKNRSRHFLIPKDFGFNAVLVPYFEKHELLIPYFKSQVFGPHILKNLNY
jgi:hypothetical protein